LDVKYTVWLQHRLLPAIVLLAFSLPIQAQETIPATSANPPKDVEWLQKESMLYQAAEASLSVSGHGVQWRHPFGEPQPREAVKKASVWLLDYPGSVITPEGKSVISTWGEPQLWKTLHDIGIELLHTGPLNRAGGVREREFTPTLDGWFDRISLDLDPDLGTEAEYRRMVAVAAEYEAVIAGDLVPLHTGLGADFHLATRNFRDYPGMYSMVQIDEKDWSLLPEVKGAWDVAHVSKDSAAQLTRKGYLPGLINSNDAAPQGKEWSGWSATGEIEGMDRKRRRWVYLHYFKPTQPALNWSDPSFAAQRAIVGDAVRTIVDRKTPIVRLDAVPFLGIEPKPGTTETLHFKHPLSVTGTDTLAYSIRKLGGWSFHELNVPLETLKKFTRHGPDLSYDFFTRAQCLDALLTEDAGALRLAFRWLLEADVQPVSLVHDLQNHDEITYQLVEPEHRKDETFDIGGRSQTGKQLRDRMLDDMRTGVAGKTAPWNKLYRPERDGVATTFAGFVAPALGVKDPYHATDDEVREIRRGHLLLTAANALQPGVFSLSSWDLVGALPIPEERVKDRIEDGDYRWINRGGVDLMGAAPDVKGSAFGLPRAQSLYGPVPTQLRDPESFASQLKVLLAARHKYRVAEAELLDVLEPKSKGLCLLLLRLPGEEIALTALNFGRQEVDEVIELPQKFVDHKSEAKSGVWMDIISGKEFKSGGSRSIRIQLPGLYGTTCVQQQPSQ
jgi:maltose alpha-D-glucosyltransferase/alpha-amylase